MVITDSDLPVSLTGSRVARSDVTLSTYQVSEWRMVRKFREVIDETPVSLYYLVDDVLDR